MNVNNYGFLFVFNTGYNLGPATDITITFTRPDLTTFTRDFSSPSPVFVGSYNLETNDGLFPAFQWAGYLIQQNDINQVGLWSARVTYFNSAIPESLTTDIVPTAQWTVAP